MKKQQLYTRLGPDVVERVIRRFNEREMSLQDAVDALGVGRTQVYNLRTQWLAAGRNASFLGDSGGDHKQAWPEAAVEHLKTLIEASLDDASRKVTAQRVCERETLLEHFAIVPVAAHPEKRRARLQDRVHGAEMADRADSQEDRVARDTSRKRGLLCP